MPSTALLYEKESEMAVDRLLPTDEGAELVALIREIAQAELAPRAAADEAGSFRERMVMLPRPGVNLEAFLSKFQKTC